MNVKIITAVLVGMLSFSAAKANHSKSKTQIRVTRGATPQQVQGAAQLQQRINEIESMDVHTLSHQERLALKKEIREIKKQARQMENVYIYFGGGFLLLLILLIILI